ncbi:hypothetical protein HC251_02235 [Iamia sp. SCSIO 61187]|uniref:hypothetical protein n=1 Tax=Iamia sp. SCSIO 61187 TaxID=2722752 RepID=UPI001C628971|nr:hypothetical protein [Iamia sp. SCSIO 61187]QYG91369.1 hypothetical protein HC251_02235 [Iamia sp. SCSIO 61187]
MQHETGAAHPPLDRPEGGDDIAEPVPGDALGCQVGPQLGEQAVDLDQGGGDVTRSVVARARCPAAVACVAALLHRRHLLRDVAISLA